MENKEFKVTICIAEGDKFSEDKFITEFIRLHHYTDLVSITIEPKELDKK